MPLPASHWLPFRGRFRLFVLFYVRAALRQGILIPLCPSAALRTPTKPCVAARSCPAPNLKRAHTKVSRGTRSSIARSRQQGLAVYAVLLLSSFVRQPSRNRRPTPKAFRGVPWRQQAVKPTLPAKRVDACASVLGCQLDRLGVRKKVPAHHLTLSIWAYYSSFVGAAGAQYQCCCFRVSSHKKAEGSNVGSCGFHSAER